MIWQCLSFCFCVRCCVFQYCFSNYFSEILSYIKWCTLNVFIDVISQAGYEWRRRWAWGCRRGVGLNRRGVGLRWVVWEWNYICIKHIVIIMLLPTFTNFFILFYVIAWCSLSMGSISFEIYKKKQEKICKYSVFFLVFFLIITKVSHT